MSSGELQDSFRALGISSSATDADIKKAYRKLSLRYHPDKAGKDVDPILAADRFHKINTAYETLMDPAARAKAQQQSAQDVAKRERQDKYEDKRRKMAEELDRSELDAVSKKDDHLRRTRERQHTIARLKEETRNILAQKQRELRSRHLTAQEQSSREEEGPEVQLLDKTVRVRFPSSQLSEAIGQASESIKNPSSPLDTPLALSLTAQFGTLEHLQFQLPAPGKKLKREVTALASFANLSHAWQAVQTGGEMRATGLLQDAYIGWATYERQGGDRVYVQPQIIRWYIRRGITRPSDIAASLKPTRRSNHEAVLTSEYESSTLQRLLDEAQLRTQTV